MTRIYAILDKKAESIIGGLMLHKHEATAVRSFCDVADDPQTSIAKHPDDFDLVCIGQLNDDNTITAMVRPLTILTAAAYRAAKQTPEDK